jgi:arsenite-transporting ATPase
MRLLELLDSESRRLILFGGKGGVGKTSLAAAAAVYTADKGKKTLIISSDPAHSLGDVFEQDQIRSGKVEKVTGVENLFALEISPKEVLHDYQHYIDEYPALKLILGDSFETLPGSNEGFGLLDIIRMYRYENYDRVIVDTAPTGHTLRLLSFPEFLNSSMVRFIRLRQALGSVVGKFTSLFRKKDASPEKDPVELLERIKRWAIEAREWLSKEETSFIVVMIPELLSIYETQRLIAEIQRNNIRVDQILVNKLFPLDTTCEFCLAKRQLQNQNMQVIQTQFSSLNPIIIPYLKSEVHGLETLRLLSQYL